MKGAQAVQTEHLSSFPSQDPLLDFQPPELPDLKLIRLVGRGSHGEVWMATTITGTWRAVKIVRRSSFSDPRPFEREFEGVKRCQAITRRHPALVDVLHVGRSAGDEFFYYVMELADAAEPQVSSSEFQVSSALNRAVGRHQTRNLKPETYSACTLRSDLKSHGRLPVAACLSVAAPLVEAVDFLHAQGLLHRDIKSSNVIYVGGQPKLADVGLVTSRDTAQSLVGTEGYLPPEGPGTDKADVYALGKLLYEISTGLDPINFPELPANFREFADREAFLNVNKLIARACDVTPSRRPTAAILARELNLLLAGKPLVPQNALRTVGRLSAAAICISSLAVWWLVGHFGGPELNRGLVAYFPFDGNARDESGQNNNLQAFGIKPAEDRFGRAARACRFDGQSSRVPIKEYLLGANAKSFTFSAWVLAESPLSNVPQMIINKGAEAGEATLQLSEGRFRFGPKLRDSSYIFAEAPAMAGKWTHVVGVYERGRRVELWVNGKLENGVKPPDEPLAQAPGFYSSIGIYQHAMGVWGAFRGSLDDVRIYDRALSAAEVRRLHIEEANLQVPQRPTKQPLDGRRGSYRS